VHQKYMLFTGSPLLVTELMTGARARRPRPEDGDGRDHGGEDGGEKLSHFQMGSQVNPLPSRVSRLVTFQEMAASASRAQTWNSTPWS